MKRKSGSTILEDGDFKLTVTWPTGIISTPIIEASLTPETHLEF